MTEPTPAQAEATRDESTITFEGVELTFITDPNKWPLDAIEAFENGKSIALMRAMFGSRTYEKVKGNFERRTGRSMTLEDLVEVLERIAKEAGFNDAGE
jgi:hypothetical protein